MKQFLFALLVLSFSRCSVGNMYRYSYALKDNGSNTFSDDNLKIDFEFTNTLIYFTLLNKSNSPIKIEWDESSIVIDSLTEKVMHTSTKFIDAERSQAPTVIPSKSKIEESIAPINHVYYQTGTKYTSGGWNIRDLFPTCDFRNKNLGRNILLNKGKSVGIFLGIYIKNEPKNYYFEFDIVDVVKKK